jgi:LysR family glycine cleavage system transcriptional activator
VAARTLSVARAATILNLTVPAVSRRIQLLERDLGMQLFQRFPRGLSLTNAGEKYFAALGPSWETVCIATEAARVKVRRRSLKISVMPTFAANWLVPRLMPFPLRIRGASAQEGRQNSREDFHRMLISIKEGRRFPANIVFGRR